MKNQVVLIIICSISWGIMMLLVRKSGLPPVIFGPIFAIVSSLVVILYVTNTVQNQIEFKEALSAHKVTFLSISLVTIGGLLSGVGSIAYYELYSEVNKFRISDFLPKTSSLIPLIAIIGSFIFLDDEVTKNKLIGIGIIISGIYFGVYFINK